MAWLFLLSVLISAAPAPAQQDATTQSTIPGSISGTITDPSGELVPGARITLTQGSATRATLADDNGRFLFDSVPAGPFRLTITAAGFAPRTIPGTLSPGESYEAGGIALAPGASIAVEVRPTSELAAEQLKAEEKQRVLGFMPNFYVTYEPNPAPLSSPQKYQLAWRAAIDPINIAFLAGFAGISQANNDDPGFGQGAAGYGKRFGATYGSFVTSTFISGAVFPQIFKEDPRYIYKGTGSKVSRTWYALKTVLICRKDNTGRFGACYSNIFGTMAGGAASNLFYTKSDRDGLSLTFENFGFALLDDAFENLMQEFVIRHFTPHLPKLTPQP